MGNRAKLENLTDNLPSKGTLKSRAIVFIDNGVDLYSSRCMSDPNFMDLAIIVSENGVKCKNWKKTCKISEP